ncbi:DNA repair protein RecN [Desulfurobacterium atlanticum]|uniref:DNA repair protein RecN n=1 Tax=Desulfurobacterium atlanticum TaxID=240169 RepID=A0A238ZYG7_9BACT|nr:AAA family ATPase [Desulfurobacterium atlanticum]SNR88172.1 DNA replication and repair protein RecN [Desulfurobacterium atlanticum]
MILSELSITNFSGIESAELLFEKGLNVIVGETGAGKSILLGTISFLEGDKGKGIKEEGTVVEAVFLDGEEEIIVRREIKGGRSRFFLNGKRVPRQFIKEKISPLITFQSQHETISLLRPSVQLKVLDSFCENWKLLSEYREIYSKYKDAVSRLDELKRQLSDRERKIDILRFQLNEFESVEWGEEIEEELLNLSKILSQAEKIKQIQAIVKIELYEGEDSASNKIGRVLREIESLGIEELSSRLSEVYYQLEDFVFEVERSLQIPDVEESVDEIEEKLYKLRKLREKYGPSWEDVKFFYEKVKKELEELENIDFELETAEKDVENLRKTLEELGEKLSSARKKGAKLLENRIKEHLEELELKHSKFKIVVEKTEFSFTGMDRVSFLFSGNPKFPLQPVGEAISGGELSRLLLSILSESGKESGVLVFDEIDTGMSGKVLSKVAEKLLKISRNTQVVAVTHSPVVVALADAVFKVEKGSDGKITVRKLESGDVEREIAVMISGEVSQGSLKAAKELMERREKLEKV